MYSDNIKNELNRNVRNLIGEFGLDFNNHDNEQLAYTILLLVKEIRELKEKIK